ncbi:MAG: ChbG/HpnK family deacetylase, partial [Rhodospirillales bacterium]|nr:ChbG/HpnK family deacetylase [Rhodospirillales bacterium]
MKQVIFSADDFGLSEAVNEGIERAHRDGILRSASLMVAAPAAADAVRRARSMPGLRVGLHLVVIEGPAVLPPAEIRAQFAAFAATGLPLDHANAHKHMHLHPTVGALLLRIGRTFGLRAVRVPAEPASVLADCGTRTGTGDHLLNRWTDLL